MRWKADFSSGSVVLRRSSDGTYTVALRVFYNKRRKMSERMLPADQGWTEQ